MKREMREVITRGGQQLIQSTTSDERWYAREISIDGTEHNKKWDFVPSVTWICDSAYPKSTGFYKWLASRGWDEAQAIKAMAGDRGSKVHQAIARLLAGGEVRHDEAFENPRSHQQEPLEADEWLCVMSFKEWFEIHKPEVIASEYTVWNEKHRYAGTVDLRCIISGVSYLVDFKTSPDIWTPMELQISAYKHADKTLPSGTKLAILQIGYKRNKVQKWKFTEIPDRYPLFLAARKIWAHETKGTKPFQREYPLSLSLNGLVKSKEVTA